MPTNHEIFEAVQEIRRGEMGSGRVLDANPRTWCIKDLGLPRSLATSVNDDPDFHLVAWVAYLCRYMEMPTQTLALLRGYLSNCVPGKRREQLAVELTVAWGCGAWDIGMTPGGRGGNWPRAEEALETNILSRLYEARKAINGRVTGYPRGHDVTSHAKEISERLRIPLRPLQSREMELSWRSAEPTFSISDIVDLPAFVEKLAKRGDAFSRFLTGQMKAMAMPLAEYMAAKKNYYELQEILVEELNELISGPFLATIAPLKDVKLRPETEERLLRHPIDGQTGRVNRMIVEDAYPKELSSHNPVVDLVFSDMQDRMLRGHKRIFQIDGGGFDVRTKDSTHPCESGILALNFIRTPGGRDFLQVAWARSVNDKLTNICKLFRDPQKEDELSSAEIHIPEKATWYSWECGCGNYKHCINQHRLEGWALQFSSRPRNPVSLWSFIVNAIRGRDRRLRPNPVSARPPKRNATAFPPPFAIGAFSVAMYYPCLSNGIPGETYRLLLAPVRERLCPNHARPYDGENCNADSIPEPFDAATHRQVNKRRLILEGYQPPLHTEEDLWHCGEWKKHFRALGRARILRELAALIVTRRTNEEWENYYTGQYCPICQNTRPERSTKLFARTPNKPTALAWDPQIERHIAGVPQLAALPRVQLDLLMATIQEDFEEVNESNRLASIIAARDDLWALLWGPRSRDWDPDIERLVAELDKSHGQDIFEAALRYLGARIDHKELPRVLAQAKLDKDREHLNLFARVRGTASFGLLMKPGGVEKIARELKESKEKIETLRLFLLGMHRDLSAGAESKSEPGEQNTEGMGNDDFGDGKQLAND